MTIISVRISSLLVSFLLTFAAFSQPADRVEQLIVDLSEKAKDQISVDKPADKINFGQHLNDWAKANGLTTAQAEAEVNRWVSGVQQQGDDAYKLGLALFYKKDFAGALKQFSEDARAKAAKIIELRNNNQLTEEVRGGLISDGARDLRLAGRAALFNSDLLTAAGFFQDAATNTSKETHPELWASTIFELGQVYSELGLRTSGEDSEKLFSNSQEAFRRALEVFTREGHPQRWAECQNSLGATLASQGLRIEGNTGLKLLSDGAAALKKSLEVFTRESTPLLWAKTQNNLGAALAEQGMRGTGEEGLRLLLDAIQCYRAALEVRTFESLPQEWASTQNNLASVYYFMKDWPKVAESYTNVLKVFPNSQLAYRTASELHQKVLFNFDLAFKLNQDWLKQNPNDLLEKVKFAEKLFTTGKYPESLAQVTEFVQNKDYSGLVHSVMRIIEVPNLIALKKAGMIPAKLDTMLELVKSQPENFRIEFNTAGMLYYVNQNTLFESYRVWLEKFFGIIAGQNRDAIYITLEEAKKAFPSTNSN